MTGTFAAATTGEEGGQLVGQGDRRGIAQKDSGERLELRSRGRFGSDALLKGLFQGFAEEIDEWLPGGEAFLDGGL